MKILDIHINEYTSLDQLRNDIDELDLHNPKHMIRLFDTRKDAMTVFKQCISTDSRIRPFYYVGSGYNGTDYFQLYELVVD